MSCQDSLAEWTSGIRTHLPLLRKPQATVLVLWSLGMVLARSCALSAVSVWLAALLQRKDNTVRQQLREWCDEAQAKRGTQRQALVGEDGFMPLLGWVLGHWQGTQLALARAAPTVGLRVTVLAVSVVSRGGAIPVAWTILPAHQPAAWRCHWLRLLRQLRPAIPKGHTVIVLADRGLYALWLFRRIVRLGWHPFLRINRGGPFRPDPQATDRPLSGFVPLPGTRWRGTGTAFTSPQRRLRCTRLACGEAGYTEPWLILTDVPPEASDAGWYGRRAWIEPGFQITKRAGWLACRGHAPGRRESPSERTGPPARTPGRDMPRRRRGPPDQARWPGEPVQEPPSSGGAARSPRPDSRYRGTMGRACRSMPP